MIVTLNSDEFAITTLRSFIEALPNTYKRLLIPLVVDAILETKDEVEIVKLQETLLHQKHKANNN